MATRNSAPRGASRPRRSDITADPKARALVELENRIHDDVVDALHIVERNDLHEQPAAAAKLPAIEGLAKQLVDELDDLFNTKRARATVRDAAGSAPASSVPEHRRSGSCAYDDLVKTLERAQWLLGVLLNDEDVDAVLTSMLDDELQDARAIARENRDHWAFAEGAGGAAGGAP
jgi:hypothetical protein